MTNLDTQHDPAAEAKLAAVRDLAHATALDEYNPGRTTLAKDILTIVDGDGETASRARHGGYTGDTPEDSESGTQNRAQASECRCRARLDGALSALLARGRIDGRDRDEIHAALGGDGDGG